MYGLDHNSREAIQKFLRTADEQFRAKNFTNARVALEKALEIDPRNSLARTFLERVKLAEKQELKPESPSAPAAAGDERLKMIPQLFRDLEQLMSARDLPRAEQKAREILSIEPSNFYAKAYLDNITELKKQPAPAPVAPPVSAAPASAPVAAAAPKPHSAAPSAAVDAAMPKGSLSMYRELLREFWFDGKISPEEEEELKSVRELFRITGDEHVALEREVKLQAYINALQTAWTDGVVTQNEQNVLEMMRMRYSISAEEHLSAEAKIEEAKRTRRNNGTVLLVDGDMESLSALMGELKRRNYDAMIAHDAADALTALLHRTPDIVISEIFFEGHSSDGFSLFKKLQSLPNYKGIPFFFMTSLIDNKITRAGIRLGIGNIFYKPLDMKLVVAALDRTMQVKV